MARYLPTFGHTADGARPHLEVDELGYHYVVVERGMELKRSTTRDLDELCYWIFRASTRSLAGDLSVAASKSGEDQRRTLFEIHLNLLATLSHVWAARLAGEYHDLLQEAPFDDNAFLRANRARALREQGIDDVSAAETAMKEHPPRSFPTIPGGFGRKVSDEG